MSRRTWPALLTVLVAAVAVAVVLLSHRPAPPLSTRVDQVAKTVRCPTCAGESVAASDSPIARSMRAEIRHQLQQGRTPDQVRTWFAARYGADIVTTPSSSGPELVLWLVPAGVLLAGGLALFAWWSRRDADPAPVAITERRERKPAPAPAKALSGRRVLVALVVCLAAGAAVPAALALPSNGSGTSRAADAADAAARLGPRDWLALGVSLDRRGDPAGAERAYRRALALVPRDAAARTRLAFDLMRAGHLAPAERLVRPVAARRGPYRPLALLVLGLAERGRGEAAATATLRRFLQVAPHHPAAVQVRRLLGGRR